MRKVKAVDYRRSATNDEQQLKEQNAMAMKHCEENGYELVGGYTDAGISGSSTDRSGFKQMMADAKDNKFNIIIAANESRISRNIVEFLQFIQELENYNCKFETVNGSNDSNGDWRNHWANKLTLHQLERLLSNDSEEKENISTNVKLAPVDETDIEVVKQIFAEYAKGEHSSRIKQGLAAARTRGVVLGRPPKKV